MNFSLNEVETIAKKAARGAGYSWGMAEEAAKATRWLCAHGLDGCASLASLLGRTDGAVLADMMPKALNGEWEAPSGQLCPVLAGAAMSDCATRLTQTDIEMAAVIEPVLILPFAAVAARQLGATISVVCDGIDVTTDGTAISWNDTSSLASPDVKKLTICKGGHFERTTSRHNRATPDVAVWDKLQSLAARTYAPATAESRLLGAGTGVSDND